MAIRCIFFRAKWRRDVVQFFFPPFLSIPRFFPLLSQLISSLQLNSSFLPFFFIEFMMNIVSSHFPCLPHCPSYFCPPIPRENTLRPPTNPNFFSSFNLSNHSIIQQCAHACWPPRYTWRNANIYDPFFVFPVVRLRGHLWLLLGRLDYIGVAGKFNGLSIFRPGD